MWRGRASINAMFRFYSAVLLLLGLSSCGHLGRAVSKVVPKEEPKPQVNGGIPETLLPGRGAQSLEEVKPTEVRSVGVGQDPAKVSGIAGLPAQEDILFLDPDDHEASEDVLSGLAGIQKKDWLTSHSVARKYSMVEGKPLLIFFTNTPSPTNTGSFSAAALEKELFARSDFSEWASERFVRVKLDFNVKEKDRDQARQSLARKKKRYLESLKKRYRVGGLPVVLVLAPDGTEVQRIRGYTAKNYEYTWGLLRTAEIVAKDRYEAYEATLEKKGYRRWTGKNDLRILARLASYKEGDLLLIEPSGERHKTNEKNLSRADRKWLTEEKEKRLLKKNGG